MEIVCEGYKKDVYKRQVMKNGKIVTKVSGARPKKAILEML